MTVTKPIFRLDENSGVHLPPGISDSAFILFGPLAEDGLTVAMNDPVASVIIAKRAASLIKLPEKMNSCFMKCRYPTKRVGGLSAANQGAVESWSSFFDHKLSEAITGKVRKIPVVHVVPSVPTELLHISIIWSENKAGASREDVFHFAQALEQVLWGDTSSGSTHEFLFPLSKEEKVAVSGLNPQVYEAFIRIKRGAGIKPEIADVNLSAKFDIGELLWKADVSDLERLAASVRVMVQADNAAQSDLVKAGSLYQKAVELNPFDHLASMSYGVVLAQQGHLHEGLKWMEGALLLKPDDKRVQRNLAAIKSHF